MSKHASVKLSSIISTSYFTYELSYIWNHINIRKTIWPELHTKCFLLIVLILKKRRIKNRGQMWTIASRMKITNIGMIYLAWFISIKIVSKWSSNFAGLITWLKQSSRNKPRFSKHRNYISWIKFIKQAIKIIYSKLDLKFLKLV